MNIDRRWDEMLEEFRALGGTAENICLQQGRFGRGLFPRDASKPVKVHVPKNLLVAPEHMEFFGDTCRITSAAEVSERARSFLEAYQHDFAWGSGSRQETERLLELMDKAPPELRQFRRTLFESRTGLEAPHQKMCGSASLLHG